MQDNSVYEISSEINRTADSEYTFARQEQDVQSDHEGKSQQKQSIQKLPQRVVPILLTLTLILSALAIVTTLTCFILLFKEQTPAESNSSESGIRLIPA